MQKNRELGPVALSQPLPTSLSSPGGTTNLSELANKTLVSESSGAESGALPANPTPPDPALALVIAAWPTLPEAVRRKIVKAVEVGGGKGAS